MEEKNNEPDFPGILKLYREAVKKLPVLKYSWGIIVVICILALITSLKIGTPEALLKGSIYIIGIMFLIFIFSLVAKTNDKAIKYPLYVLVYAILLTLTAFVVGFGIHSFTSHKYEIYYNLFGYPTNGDAGKNDNDTEILNKEPSVDTGQDSDSGSLREDGKAYSNKTEEAQFLLESLGYDIIYPDGKEGPTTTLALEDFQRKHNLQISGAADDQTLVVLRQRAKKPFLRKDKTED